MNSHEEQRMRYLLRQALSPVAGDAAPSRDLWPDVMRRLAVQATAAPDHRGWLWFDCALAAGLVACAAVFPAAIPVLLYYL